MSITILGLTGRIAAGKSEAAAFLVSTYKCFLFDADKEAKYLTSEPDIAESIRLAFPAARDEHGVLCRQQLKNIVFKDGIALRTLEDIIYPALRQETEDFVALISGRSNARGLIDAPLLFRAGLDIFCDRVILIKTETDIRRTRYLQRPGVNPADFDNIDASQHDIDRHPNKVHTVIDGALPLPEFHKTVSTASGFSA